MKDNKSDTVPYTVPPKDNKERYLKATHGKLTDAQKEIIAEVMSSESKEDVNLKSFIDQKIIADEELAAATAAYTAATAQQLEATVKVSELEAKLAKALDMKDVTRAESTSSSSKTSSKDNKAPRALSAKKEIVEKETITPSKKEVKAELKSDKKELSQESLSKSSKKAIKSEIKSDKKELKAIEEAEINEETGRPYGLDEVGTIHAPKLGSKLGQVEGDVVPATSRKDAKDIKTTDAIPYTVPPKAAPLVQDNKERYLKATHGKLTNAQKEIIAEVMSSESKEDVNLKSFIDQKIIADEELAAATAAAAKAQTQEMEASVKVSELEAKLAKALDMKDVTRAESTSTSSSSKTSSSKSSSHRQLEGARANVAPAPKEAVAAKKDTMSPPKKAEAPKEEKKDEKKEVDGGKPVKKTSKPTVKPTTPPKPTVPPTTKKPSEKKEVETEKVEGPKLHPASRMLAEVKKGAAPAPKEAVAGKKETMTPPKKEEAPKEEKKDAEPREVDGAKAKKTSKPTVKPTTPPKPTVPPTTKKPSEKKEVETEKVEGPKLHPASRMLAEVKKGAAPAPKEAVAGKKETMTPPKKEEAPKEEMKEEKKDEKKEAAPKEEKKVEKKEIDGGKPVKKTAKPTVKPTTPPKPTVPPTTKKPAEKHNVQDSKFDRSPRQLKKSSSLESTVSEAPAPVMEVAVDAPAISEEDRHTATDERADGPKGMFPSFIFQPVTSYHPTTSLTLYNYFISISLISTSVDFF